MSEISPDAARLQARAMTANRWPRKAPPDSLIICSKKRRFAEILHVEALRLASSGEGQMKTLATLLRPLVYQPLLELLSNGLPDAVWRNLEQPILDPDCWGWLTLEGVQKLLNHSVADELLRMIVRLLDRPMAEKGMAVQDEKLLSFAGENSEGGLREPIHILVAIVVRQTLARGFRRPFEATSVATVRTSSLWRLFEQCRQQRGKEQGQVKLVVVLYSSSSENAMLYPDAGALQDASLQMQVVQRLTWPWVQFLPIMGWCQMSQMVAVIRILRRLEQLVDVVQVPGIFVCGKFFQVNARLGTLAPLLSEGGVKDARFFFQEEAENDVPEFWRAVAEARPALSRRWKLSIVPSELVASQGDACAKCTRLLRNGVGRVLFSKEAPVFVPETILAWLPSSLRSDLAKPLMEAGFVVHIAVEEEADKRWIQLTPGSLEYEPLKSCFDLDLETWGSTRARHRAVSAVQASVSIPPLPPAGSTIILTARQQQGRNEAAQGGFIPYSFFTEECGRPVFGKAHYDISPSCRRCTSRAIRGIKGMKVAAYCAHHSPNMLDLRLLGSAASAALPWMWAGVRRSCEVCQSPAQIRIRDCLCPRHGGDICCGTRDSDGPQEQSGVTLQPLQDCCWPCFQNAGRAVQRCDVPGCCDDARVVDSFWCLNHGELVRFDDSSEDEWGPVLRIPPPLTYCEVSDRRTSRRVRAVPTLENSLEVMSHARRLLSKEETGMLSRLRDAVRKVGNGAESMRSLVEYYEDHREPSSACMTQQDDTEEKQKLHEAIPHGLARAIMRWLENRRLSVQGAGPALLDLRHALDLMAFPSEAEPQAFLLQFMDCAAAAETRKDVSSKHRHSTGQSPDASPSGGLLLSQALRRRARALRHQAYLGILQEVVQNTTATDPAPPCLLCAVLPYLELPSENSTLRAWLTLASAIFSSAEQACQMHAILLVCERLHRRTRAVHFLNALCSEIECAAFVPLRRRQSCGENTTKQSRPLTREQDACLEAAWARLAPSPTEEAQRMLLGSLPGLQDASERKSMRKLWNDFVADPAGQCDTGRVLPIAESGEVIKRMPPGNTLHSTRHDLDLGKWTPPGRDAMLGSMMWLTQSRYGKSFVSLLMQRHGRRGPAKACSPSSAGQLEWNTRQVEDPWMSVALVEQHALARIVCSSSSSEEEERSTTHRRTPRKTPLQKIIQGVVRSAKGELSFSR